MKTISSNNLPSKIGDAALPALLQQSKEVESAFATFAKYLNLDFFGNSLYAHWKDEPDIGQARQALLRAEQAARRLPAITRRATFDEIAAQIGLLFACYASQNSKAERQLFAQGWRASCAAISIARAAKLFPASDAWRGSWGQAAGASNAPSTGW